MSTNSGLNQKTNYYKLLSHIFAFIYIEQSNNKILKNTIILCGKKFIANNFFHLRDEITFFELKLLKFIYI